jgi:hypothetical protein
MVKATGYDFVVNIQLAQIAFNRITKDDSD